MGVGIARREEKGGLSARSGEFGGGVVWLACE